MEKQKKQLVKKFHTLLGKAHLDDDAKREILAQYGVTTSLDLDCKDLMEICDKMYSKVYSINNDAIGRQRRRLFAAGCRWLRESGRIESTDMVKAIACRAAKKKHFSEIPLEQLRNITYMFNNKTRDQQAVNIVVSEMSCGTRSVQKWQLN